MEHRAAKRIPRRLKVLFGATGFDQSGFTQDISETGVFVTASKLPSLGAELVLRFDSNDTTVHANVVRHSIVPAELRSVQRHGFGLCVTGNRPAMRALLEATWAGFRPAAGPAVAPPPDALAEWTSLEAWHRARTTELAQGGLSFRSVKALKFEEVVTVPVRFAFNGATSSVRVRVVHCRQEGATYVAVGLLVEKGELSVLDRLAQA